MFMSSSFWMRKKRNGVDSRNSPSALNLQLRKAQTGGTIGRKKAQRETKAIVETKTVTGDTARRLSKPKRTTTATVETKRRLSKPPVKQIFCDMSKPTSRASLVCFDFCRCNVVSSHPCTLATFEGRLEWCGGQVMRCFSGIYGPIVPLHHGSLLLCHHRTHHHRHPCLCSFSIYMTDALHHHHRHHQHHQHQQYRWRC